MMSLYYYQGNDSGRFMARGQSRKKAEANGSLIQSAARWIVDILVVIILAAFLVAMLGQKVPVEGHSMEPSLMTGDEVLTDRMIYHFFSIRRFDVVLFQAGDGMEQKNYIKRVVGLPGEKVQISDGIIYINDAPLNTGDIMSRHTVAGLAETPVTLGADEYFLLGDNGDSSEDSRFALVGNVKKEQVIGKVWFRIAPFKDLGPIAKVEVNN